MKKTSHINGFYKTPVLAFTAILFLLTACSKNNNDTTPLPAAKLMAFNLAPDKPSIGFSLSGNQFGNAALGYTNYTGAYLPITPGNRELRSFDFTGGTTIKLSNHVFADSLYYTAFLLGSNGQYRHLVVEDNFAAVTPVAGKAWVRYINAIPDTASRPNVSIGGITEGAIFGTITDFVQVNAGSLTAAISTENTSRTFTVEQHKIYTILFVGLPNQTDPNLAIQIKFIQNGIATN